MKTQRYWIIIFILMLAVSTGCATMGIALLYKKVDLPASQIIRNIQYSKAPDADPIKNRLDLFLPQDNSSEKWPTMIFVHGGGWSEGDKDLKIAGADVYGNIGRYFASKGIGAAIISYGLIPHVDWKTQVLDVAKATAWVYKNIHQYRGDPKMIFLAGHSAGAQLASRVALDTHFLNSLGLSPRIVCGVIPVSGVGYNFLNEEMYQFGKDQGAIQTLFHEDDISKSKRRRLSSSFFIKKSSPPFLTLYATGDPKEIKNASLNLDKSLLKVQARHQIYSIPKVNHKSMILALSHSKKLPATLMMIFMRSTECGGTKG